MCHFATCGSSRGSLHVYFNLNKHDKNKAISITRFVECNDEKSDDTFYVENSTCNLASVRVRVRVRVHVWVICVYGLWKKCQNGRHRSRLRQKIQFCRGSILSAEASPHCESNKRNARSHAFAWDAFSRFTKQAGDPSNALPADSLNHSPPPSRLLLAPPNLLLAYEIFPISRFATRAQLCSLKLSACKKLMFPSQVRDKRNVRCAARRDRTLGRTAPTAVNLHGNNNNITRR